MPDQLLAPMMPALGLDFLQKDLMVITTAAVFAGQVMEIDTSRQSALSTDDLTASPSSQFVNAAPPTTNAAIGGRLVVIAQQRGSAGQRILARLKGRARVFVFGEFSAGSLIILTSAGDDTAEGKRIFGHLLESGGAENVFTRAEVLWDGEIGFGQIIGESVGEGDPPTFPADDLPGYDPDPPDPGGGPDGEDLPGGSGTVGVPGHVVEE